MMSLQLASCSMIVQRRQGTLGRQQWTVVLPEHPMLKWRMTTNVVDQESWRLAEECQPGRVVQVHGCTGKPWRRNLAPAWPHPNTAPRITHSGVLEVRHTKRISTNFHSWPSYKWCQRLRFTSLN